MDMIDVLLAQMLRKFTYGKVFVFKNTDTIPPNNEYLFDFETLDKKTGKFLPFEIVCVFNNSDKVITCSHSDDERIVLPNSEIILNDVRYLKIKNITSDTIDVNEIVVNCQGKYK